MTIETGFSYCVSVVFPVAPHPGTPGFPAVFLEPVVNCLFA
jgi:hypothetical protein